MIPEKVTWVQFPARINTVYSKLPPINDLFLKILNQTDICHRFSFRISDQKFFSAMLLQNIVHWNKFFNFLYNFLHSFMLIWPLQILLISWLLIKKVSVLRFLHFGDFNNSLSVQLLGGNNIEGRGDILVNFSLWNWAIFHLHYVGPICIDHITSFFNQLSC